MATVPSSSAELHPLRLFLRQLELHSKLGAEAKDAVLALPFHTSAVEAGSYILREDDMPVACAVLVDGFAYRQKETVTGKRQIVSLHNPGEALDLQQLALMTADHSLRMLTDGEVAYIDHKHLQRLMTAHSDLAEAIFRATLIEASIFREWVLNVGRRDARTRIAHVLCEFAMRLDRSGLTRPEGYLLPMSQEQLADTTGLTTVHINRILKVLAAEGLIVRKVRGIAFESWTRLKEIGGFDGRYLHIDHQTPRARERGARESA